MLTIPQNSAFFSIPFPTFPYISIHFPFFGSLVRLPFGSSPHLLPNLQLLLNILSFFAESMCFSAADLRFIVVLGGQMTAGQEEPGIGLTWTGNDRKMSRWTTQKLWFSRRYDDKHWFINGKSLGIVGKTGVYIYILYIYMYIIYIYPFVYLRKWWFSIIHP